MKLNKRQTDLISCLYNDHLESCHIKNLHIINAGLELVEKWPDMFEMERFGYRTYDFKIKNLGYVPDFIKEYSK